MGNRLSRIYTRTGDSGTTGLADSSRVDKDSPRIEAIGAIDELNCALGVLLAAQPGTDHSRLLTGLQHQLFDLGGELALPGSEVLEDRHVTALEQALDAINRKLPPLKEFVLPRGGASATAAHMARAQCRRAERAMWRLSREEPINPASLRFLNRLSDLLFVMARDLGRQTGPEVSWSHEEWEGDSGGE